MSEEHISYSTSLQWPFYFRKEWDELHISDVSAFLEDDSIYDGEGQFYSFEDLVLFKD